MDISIFKIFMIFGLVSTWASKALADGKITIVEAVELATLIAGVLGVTLAIDVPAAAEAASAGSDLEESLETAEVIEEPVKARPPDN